MTRSTDLHQNPSWHKHNASEMISAQTMVELRPAQSLKLWQDVSMALVHEGHADLSSRQLSILLTIYLEPPPHTVRGLAAKLDVSKPVITRALNTMGGLGLVDRRRDPKDRRNVIVQRTVGGSEFLEEFAELIGKKALELPR